MLHSEHADEEVHERSLPKSE